MVTRAYKPRHPKASTLYRCVQDHIAEFETIYAEQYQEQYGFYRSVIGRVVGMRDYVAEYDNSKNIRAVSQNAVSDGDSCRRRMGGARPVKPGEAAEGHGRRSVTFQRIQ